MNYDWAPISEPPDDSRHIVLWMDVDQGYWIPGYYEYEEWYHNDDDDYGSVITSPNLTHWKDIEAPKI